MGNDTDKQFAAEAADANLPGNPAEAPEELAPSEWTHEQVAEWRDKANKAQENWDRLVRVSADFENFKKRAARERQDAIRYANEGLLDKLIPIVDNFDMALASAQQAQAGSAEALRTGVQMIQTQLRNVLTDAGLEEIVAQGQPFDPNLHEAVSEQVSADVPEGHVLQQIRKGYKLKDRLIRPAAVVVAKAASS